MIDASELARKLLSAAYRTGQSFGLGHLQKVLTGQTDDRVVQRGHERLSVFGIVDAAEGPPAATGGAGAAGARGRWWRPNMGGWRCPVMRAPC